MCTSHLFLRHTTWCICPSLLRWRKSDCTKPYRSDRQVSQCAAPYWEKRKWVRLGSWNRESADSQWKQGTVTQGQKWRGGNFRIIAYARGCFYICFPSSRDSPHLKKQSLFRFLSNLGSVDKQKNTHSLLLDCPTWNCEDAAGSTSWPLAEDGTGECNERGELHPRNMLTLLCSKLSYFDPKSKCRCADLLFP